jgi:hypothetical protein
MSKFVVGGEYVETLLDTQVIEAEDAKAAVIEYDTQRNIKAEAEHKEKQEQRRARKKGSTISREFKRITRPITVLDVEAGTVSEFTPKPPPPPPPEQWEWHERKLTDDDMLEEEDEDDEDDLD